MQISVVINTYNASKHLKEVLEAVKEFDEVLVCDMESTDDTCRIAAGFGCRIITFPKGLHQIVEPARDFAIKQARCPWVLVVDADEIVTPELKNYLYSRIQESNCPDGLYIPRKNYFMGQFMHCHYPDYILRFFRREKDFLASHHTHLTGGRRTGGKDSGKPQGTGFHPSGQRQCGRHSEKDQPIYRVRTGKEKAQEIRYHGFLLPSGLPFPEGLSLQGGIPRWKSRIYQACLEGYYQFIMLAKMTERKKNS